MDYNNSYQPIINPRRSRWMEGASMTLGLFAILGSCLVYPAMFCGSLAIVLALLSRGGELTLSSKSKLGLTLGIVALVFVVIAMAFTFYILVSYYGSIFNIPLDSSGTPMIDTQAILDYYMNQSF